MLILAILYNLYCLFQYLLVLFLLLWVFVVVVILVVIVTVCHYVAYGLVEAIQQVLLGLRAGAVEVLGGLQACDDQSFSPCWL